MEEVRLAVRYRNDLRLGDLIRSWMDLGDRLLTDHLSRWLMDLANRWLMARNHFQIRWLNRFAND